jgi:hypothetical protein
MDQLNIIVGYQPSSLGEAFALQRELGRNFGITCDFTPTLSNFNMIWYVVKETKGVIGPPVHRLIVSNKQSFDVYTNLDNFIRVLISRGGYKHSDHSLNQICQSIRVAHHEYVESRGAKPLNTLPIVNKVAPLPNSFDLAPSWYKEQIEAWEREARALTTSPSITEEEGWSAYLKEKITADALGMAFPSSADQQWAEYPMTPAQAFNPSDSDMDIIIQNRLGKGK